MQKQSSSTLRPFAGPTDEYSFYTGKEKTSAFHLKSQLKIPHRRSEHYRESETGSKYIKTSTESWKHQRQSSDTLTLRNHSNDPDSTNLAHRQPSGNVRLKHKAIGHHDRPVSDKPSQKERQKITYSIKNLLAIIYSFSPPERVPELHLRYGFSDSSEPGFGCVQGLSREMHKFELKGIQSDYQCKKIDEENRSNTNSKLIYPRESLLEIINAMPLPSKIIELASHNWGSKVETGPIVPFEGLAIDQHKHNISKICDEYMSISLKTSDKMIDMPKVKYSRRYLLAIFRSLPVPSEVPELMSHNWGSKLITGPIFPIQGLAVEIHKYDLRNEALSLKSHGNHRKDEFQNFPKHEKSGYFENSQNYEGNSFDDVLPDELWDMPQAGADMDHFKSMSNDTSIIELERVEFERQRALNYVKNEENNPERENSPKSLGDSDEILSRSVESKFAEMANTQEKVQPPMPFDEYINSLFSSDFSRILNPSEFKIPTNASIFQSKSNIVASNLFSFTSTVSNNAAIPEQTSRLAIWSAPLEVAPMSTKKQTLVPEMHTPIVNETNTQVNTMTQTEELKNLLFGSVSTINVDKKETVKLQRNEKSTNSHLSNSHPQQVRLLDSARNVPLSSSNPTSIIQSNMLTNRISKHSPLSNENDHNLLCTWQELSATEGTTSKQRSVEETDLMSVLGIAKPELKLAVKPKTSSSNFSFHPATTIRPGRGSIAIDRGSAGRGMRGIIIGKKVGKGGRGLTERKVIPKSAPRETNLSTSANQISSDASIGSSSAQEQARLLKDMLQIS